MTMSEWQKAIMLISKYGNVVCFMFEKEFGDSWSCAWKLGHTTHHALMEVIHVSLLQEKSL